MRNRSRTYRSWDAMIQRCQNPNHNRFKWYGAKGIKVCARWRVFENFLADMGERPDGMTIDRQDETKDYEPGNCVWATQKEQQRGKRRLIEHGGEAYSLTDWAEKTGIKRATLKRRMQTYGWSASKALTTPVQGGT